VTRSYRAIIALAWPILAVQVTVIASAVVDTAMAGLLSPRDLAAIGLGASIYVTVFVALLGILLGLSPIVAQLVGANRHAEIGPLVTQALWLALFLSAPGIVALIEARWLMQLIGTPPDVQATAQLYLVGSALGLPGALVFRVFYTLHSSISRPKVVLWINAAALLVKVPLNRVFMMGVPGVEPLGAAGAGFASAVVGWLSAAAALALVLRGSWYRSLGIPSLQAPRWRVQKALLGVGVPIGVMQLTEVASFTSMALCIARLGPVIAGAHQIAANIATTIFMVPLALSLATSVVIAQAAGARDEPAARACARAGVHVVVGFAVLATLALLLLRMPIARAYTSDVAVQSVAAALLVWTALSQLGDGVQTLFIAILRAYRVTIPGAVIAIVARWGVGLGGGYWLAYGSPAMGVQGFWCGGTAGFVVAGAAAVSVYLAMRPRLQDRVTAAFLPR
jgi:multidrug resistance protein, MATE family